jgi:hypothetical protein
VANELRHRVSRVAVLDSTVLAIACLVTFMVVTDILSRAYHLSRADDLIGASALSPQHAWQQPILRLAGTVVGVAIGVAAAWLGLRVTGQQAGASQ